jgi:ER degradation enhancer, mannosidase alpha-like 2
MTRFVVLLLLLPTLSTTAAQTPTDLPSQSEMATQIRGQFLHAWNSYRRYAWGHDELRPLTNQPFDWYGTSLLMTPVDALDTMILMGLSQQADEDRRLIDTQLSFDKDIYVKNFEITIRLLGALQSSYELTGDSRLLALADDLGTRLLPVFNSPTGMPYVNVNLKTGAVRGVATSPAEIGTLLLEFGTLSKLTHKPIYYQKAKRAMVELYNRRSPVGLFGDEIDVRTGQWTGNTSSINGGSDSFYEYMLKAWKLFGDEDCHRMWETSVAALNQYVAQTVTNPDGSASFWYGEADRTTGARTGTQFGALAAFFPAELALSGDLDRARRLEDSSYRMWNLAGIEPEIIDYSTMKILSPGYELRPEIIESAYYLYYFTRDPRYRQMGMTFFSSIVKYCRTPSAFAALSNVETKTQRDDMESYFFAETLKYLYLLLANPDRIDLHKTVFNTEAHPLSVDLQPLSGNMH